MFEPVQDRLAGSVPPSTTRPLMALLEPVKPLITGLEARSMLMAAPTLSRKVSPVTVGLLWSMRNPMPLEL